MKKLLIACLVLSLFQVAGAVTYTKRLNNCLKNSPTRPDQFECVDKEDEIFSKLITKEYNRIMKSMPPTKKKDFKNEQRAWLAFRDAAIKLAANEEGEDGTALIYEPAYRSLELNMQRYYELKDY